MEIQIGAKLVEALCQVRRNSSSSPSSAKLSSSSVGRHNEIRDAANWVLAVSAPRPHMAHAELKPPMLVWSHPHRLETHPPMVPCRFEATHSDLSCFCFWVIFLFFISLSFFFEEKVLVCLKHYSCHVKG